MESNKSFEANWPQTKAQLKKEHPELTDEDLHYDPGKEEELLLRLQTKLNKTKKEIRNWLHILG